MLRDYHDLGTTVNDEDIMYDVVILEFSTNDSLDNLRDSLRVLACRIRTRYPNALMKLRTSVKLNMSTRRCIY